MIGLVDPRPHASRQGDCRGVVSSSTSHLQEQEEDYTYLLIERRRRRLNRYRHTDEPIKESRSKSVETRLLAIETRGKLLKSDTWRPRSSSQDTASSHNSLSSLTRIESRSPFKGNHFSKREYLTSRCRSASTTASRSSADSDYDSAGADFDRRPHDRRESRSSVGNIRDSPKWSQIKKKFETQTSNLEDGSPTKCSSPHARRRSCPISPLSSSMSNLSHHSNLRSSTSSTTSSKDLTPRASGSPQRVKMLTTDRKVFHSANFAHVSYNNERLSRQKNLSNSTPSVNLTSKLIFSGAACKISSRSNNDLSGLHPEALSSQLAAEAVSRVVKLAARFDPLLERKLSSRRKTGLSGSKQITSDEENEGSSKVLSVKERVMSLEKQTKSPVPRAASASATVRRALEVKSSGNSECSNTAQRCNSIPIPHPRKHNSSTRSVGEFNYDLPKPITQGEKNEKNEQHGMRNKCEPKNKRLPLPNPRKLSVLQNTNSPICRSPSSKSLEPNPPSAVQNSEYETIGAGQEENIYESLWSLSRPCESPVAKAIKKFSDSDDLSLNSDEFSIYSDSSSYSSGNYEYSGLPKGVCPPPLPPRRFNSTSQKGSYSNISTVGPVSCESRVMAEELVDIYRSSLRDCQDEEHIYQCIYDRIQNTEGFSKAAGISRSENEELLKSLIKELQKIVKEAKLGKGKLVEDDATSRGSEDSSDRLSRGSFSSKSGSSSDGSPKSSFKAKRPTSFNCKSKQPDANSGGDYVNISGKDARYANCPPISEDSQAQRNSLIASIIDSTSEDIKQFLASTDRKRQSCTSSTSEAYVTANVFEEQKRPNLNALEDDSRIYPFSPNKLVTVRQLSENERYIDFEKSDDSPLENQPLYQFYDKHVKRREALMMYADSSLGDIEDYLDSQPESLCTDSEGCRRGSKNHLSVMDIVDGGFRRLWCEVPQVKEQGILEKLTPQERKLQEAMFEVITSEASYLKSLNILINNFCNHPDFQNADVMDARKRKDFFSNIEQVFEVAKKLMADLEKIWQQNMIISGVCEILYYYATNHFQVYVTYCKYQMNQERLLRELQDKSKFAEVLKRLEANACCQGLTILSFILLPMQRITRYPLLVDAILTRLEPNSPEMEVCKKTLLALNKVVSECNSAARQFERWHELSEVERKLRFVNIKKFPLASASRFLLKKGEVTRIKPEFQTPLLIGSVSKTPYWTKSQNYLFLFNDLLVITKRKSEDSFNVYDYCDRNLVQMLPINNGSIEGGPLAIGHKPPESFRCLVQVTLLHNHSGKSVDYYFNFSSENERLRWIEAIEPPKSDNPNEKIYEEWDCPQVLCERRYLSQQPDELSLEESDVINVFRKSANDWYEGERIRDGARGWFPASHTVEIANKHVRARNLRIRHRLMILTESILEKQHQQHQQPQKN